MIFIYLSIYLFIYWFIYSPSHAFIHSLTDLFICLSCLEYSPRARGSTHIREQPPLREEGQHFDLREPPHSESDRHKCSVRLLHSREISSLLITGQVTLPENKMT